MLRRFQQLSHLKGLHRLLLLLPQLHAMLAGYLTAPAMLQIAEQPLPPPPRMWFNCCGTAVLCTLLTALSCPVVQLTTADNNKAVRVIKWLLLPVCRCIAYGVCHIVMA